MAIKNPPKGYHTVNVGLTVDGCAEAVDFYVKAFGAEPGERMLGPGGKIMHTEIRIGDSVVMLNDPAPEMGSHATTSSMYLYVDDCDALHRRAVAAGARSTFEPTDCFWGDRMSQVVDKWGNKWSMSTRIKEMTPDEQRQAGQEFMKKTVDGRQ